MVHKVDGQQGMWLWYAWPSASSMLSTHTGSCTISFMWPQQGSVAAASHSDLTCVLLSLPHWPLVLDVWQDGDSNQAA